MEYSFPHYLLAKRSVDDRAINKDVFQALKAHLPPAPIRIIEIGAGIGSMIPRLIQWGLLTSADYLALDEMQENIAYASEWLPQWARSAGLQVERLGPQEYQLRDHTRNMHIAFRRADVFEYIDRAPTPSDLLIAHAVLDLFPLPRSLPKLLSLTGRLAWLTINFDGLTALEPTVDAQLDAAIERLYHESMDARRTGGDSRTGRHLFTHLASEGAQVLAAGSSDWVVHAVNGQYPADEAYFLHFILHFFEESLGGHPRLDAQAFALWLARRRAQVERGELVYIAHQLDLLAQRAW